MNFSGIISDVSNVVTALGLPLAIGTWLWQIRRERISRERDTHGEMNSRYMAYLQLVLTNPSLELQDFELSRDRDLNQKLPLSEAMKITGLEILINMFERAFFLYHGHSSKFREQQWKGWDEYIRGWTQREEFRKYWFTYLRGEFHSDFNDYIESIMAKSLDPYNMNDRFQ